MTEEHELLRELHLSIYDYLHAVDKKKSPLTLSNCHRKLRGLVGDTYKLYYKDYEYDI